MEDEDKILVGTMPDGGVVYWTGKAGDGWVSSERRDAYRCTCTYAAYRVEKFNAFTQLHGVTFSAGELS